jgi:hypothetical protein
MRQSPLIAAYCKRDDANVVEWSRKPFHYAACEQACLEVSPIAIGAAVAGPFIVVKVLKTRQVTRRHMRQQKLASKRRGTARSL